MPDPRIKKLQTAAVAALEDAESRLRSAELSDDEGDGWGAEFAEMLADGMSACRWFVSMGFKPPGNFGYWLFRVTEVRISMQSSHKELDDAVNKASGAIYELDKEWDRWWSEQKGANETE